MERRAVPSGPPAAPGPPAPLQGLWSTASLTRIAPAPARRARLSIARHRPQPRGFRGNALRLGSRHVSAEVSAISIPGPGSLASACRTTSLTPDLLSNIYPNTNIPLDTFRARAPAWPSTRRDLFPRGLCARYMPLPPARPAKNRATRVSSAPGARQAPSPEPKIAVLQKTHARATFR